ncbi:discoidin domain-containing protein [Nonomuraea sp. 3N208]|uniref:discoidin domain-containing protein n=1 Tax=Nonomuraea sp. 3N208 TaxID=3457421 RepID=UPI003FCF3A84
MGDIDIVSQLRRLAQLHSDGCLTDEEFALAKERLLSQAADFADSAKAAESFDTQTTRPLSHGGHPQEPKANTLNSSTGKGLAAVSFLVAGILTLLFFFTLPMGTLPILGSFTASDLANMPSEEATQKVLWLVPAAGVAIAGAGLRLCGSNVTSHTRNNASTVVLALTILVVLIYVIALGYALYLLDQSGISALGYSATDLIGTGFWLVLGAMVIAGGVAVAELIQSALGARKDALDSKGTTDANTGPITARQAGAELLALVRRRFPPIRPQNFIPAVPHDDTDSDERSPAKRQTHGSQRRLSNIFVLSATLLILFTLTGIVVLVNINSDEPTDEGGTETTQAPIGSPDATSQANLSFEETRLVPANQYWIDSGINVESGRLEFVSDGMVKTSEALDPNIDIYSPQGQSSTMAPYGRNFPGPGLHPYSLIGKVGDGEVFEVGREASVQIAEPGRLYLGINDDFVEDNSGEWSVTIKFNGTTETKAAESLLSLARPATSSSIEKAALGPEKAFDGDFTTRWGSLEFTDPQWLQIDLGSPKNISRVRLFWETAYGKTYQIQVSNDAAVWTTVYETAAGDGNEDDLTGLSGTGRYVRMYGTERGTRFGYSLYEMQVYGT